MKIKGNIPGIAEGLLSLILTVGAFTFMRACDSEEGRYMACHWAQNAVILSGIVLILLSLARVFLTDKGIKAGLAIGIFAVALSVIFIPGTAISLCMMETMRCHTVFRPAVTVLASLLTVTAGIDSVTGIIGAGKGR